MDFKKDNIFYRLYIIFTNAPPGMLKVKKKLPTALIRQINPIDVTFRQFYMRNLPPNKPNFPTFGRIIRSVQTILA